MKKMLFAALVASSVSFASVGATTSVSKPAGLTDLTDDTASRVTSTTSTSQEAWLVGPGTAFHNKGTGNKDTGYRVIRRKPKACNIIYTFDAATTVNAYAFCVFDNNMPTRAPKKWNFYGSNTYDPSTKEEPDNTWTLIDERDNETDWGNSEYRYFQTSNATAYTSYKMDILDNNGEDYIQFNFMEFFFDMSVVLPAFGECSLTRVQTGECLLSGVIVKNKPTSLSLVLTPRGEGAEKSITLEVPEVGVTFEKTVLATTEGLSTKTLYEAKLVAENEGGSSTNNLGQCFFGKDPEATDFLRRIDFTLSDAAKTALADSSEAGVPVAVRLSSAIQDFSYEDFNADHSDLTFGVADEQGVLTSYPYEVESWNPEGESVIWVKVPVFAAETEFSMFYGKDAFVPNSPKDVWSDYVGVWHMTGGAGNETDVTGHGLNGVPTGSKLTEMTSDANAVVGVGRVNQTTAGKYNRLSVPSYNDFITSHSLFTVSGWFKSTDATGYPRPLSRKNNYNEATGWEIQYNSNSKTQCEMRGSSDKQVTMDGPDVTADWVHLAYVFNGTTGTAYANGGASKKSGTITAVAKRDDPMAIGNNSNGSEQSWCGSYDEVRLYDGVQSDARVKAEYLSMTPGFLVAGAAISLDPEAPELGECALTKVRDGEYSVTGVLAKNDAAVKLVFSAEGGEVVEKELGDQSEGVGFETSVTKADGLSDAYPYDVKIVATNDHGRVEKALGSIGLWFPTSINDFAKKFTVTVPETVTDTLEGFPLLVRLSAANVEGFDYGDVQQNGADIVAADASGNFLPCEFQSYDPNGESLLWVRVPSMTANTEITIYYGNPKPLIEIPSAKDTWSDYAGVWHLDETTAGTTAIKDSTANATDGTAHAKSLVAEGILGGARGRTDATGTNGAMATMPKNAALDALTPEFTVSGWVMPTTTSISWAYVFSRKNADSYKSWGWQFRADSSLGSIGIYASGTSDSDSQRNVFSQSTIKQNVWTKYNVVYTSTQVSLYLDGKLVATQDIKPGAAVNGDLDFTIGGLNGSGHGTLKGYHDEVRLRRGAVGADWAAAEYAQETDVFGTYGAAEPVDASAPVFLTPIATVDAQGEVTVTISVVEGEGSVYVDVDGEKTKIGDIDTEGAYPQEFVAHPTIAAGEDVMISAYGINANGTEVYKKSACGTMNAAVVATKTRDAEEDSLRHGIFTLSRPDTATNNDLVVSLGYGGTAEAGVDFEDNLPESVTIPAGETAVTVEVTPIINMAKTSDTTVELTVGAGAYISGGTATVMIKNLELDPDFNTWIGAGADDKASTAANWSLGVPQNGQAVLFDGRFMNPDNKNCTWDIDVNTVASWTQRDGYDGTVTLPTVYPGKAGIAVFTVTGAMTIESGVLTHPQSRTIGDNHNAQWDWIGDLKANETYRLNLAVGSLSVGADGAIDVATKGYYASHDSARCNASHGGTTRKEAAVYGDPKEPIHIGMAHRTAGGYYNGKGGGAIYITVTGDAVVDGAICADSGNTGHGAGAAGSVYLKANSLTGTGSITARGSASGEGNYKGTGGRIAIVTETPVVRGTFAAISAEAEWKNAQNGQATEFGGCGTVFFKDSTMTNGKLVVAGKSDWPALSWANRNRVTPVGTEGEWTFDAVEVGRGGTLAVPYGTAIHLPGGFASLSSTSDNAGCAGIKYEGGTLDIGSNANQTMSGKWMLFAPSNCVINANLTVQGGAMIGIPEYGNITEEGSVLPEFPSCIVTVNGNLTLASDGLMKAENCGFKKSDKTKEKGLVGYGSHGGRSMAAGTALALHYVGYDSVFHPWLPGSAYPWTGGQGAGKAGGVLNCSVSGILTVNGTISANGSLGGQAVTHNDNAGSGGAIELTAGEIVGSGVIQADGGYNGGNSCGGGGRIAIRLTKPGATFDDFTGRIVASGRYSQDVANASHSSSAGSVYLETVADGEKGGAIRIAQGLNYTQNALNTNTTEIVSLGYGGDAVEDYKKVKLEVRDYGRAAVNVDVKMAALTVATEDAHVDFEGHTLTVRAAKVNGEKVPAGTYAIPAGGAHADYPALYNSANTDGSLVVTGGGLMLYLR